MWNILYVNFTQQIANYYGETAWVQFAEQVWFCITDYFFHRIHKYMYIHTYMYTYKQTYIHAYKHTNKHTYMHTYLQTSIHTCIHTYKQT